LLPLLPLIPFADPVWFRSMLFGLGAYIFAYPFDLVFHCGAPSSAHSWVNMFAQATCANVPALWFLVRDLRSAARHPS
jgi:hypothetical protein